MVFVNAALVLASRSHTLCQHAQTELLACLHNSI